MPHEKGRLFFCTPRALRLSLATAHMMCLEPEDSQKYIDEGLPLSQLLGLHFRLLLAWVANL